MDIKGYPRVPTESEEQQALMRWAAVSQGRLPELALLHHIPNGGSRRKAEAGRFKAEGVKSGVPDLCLPVPRAGKHGLYIEMKRTRNSRVSDEQKEWFAALDAQGYAVAVCLGWEEARNVIEAYVQGKRGTMREDVGVLESMQAQLATSKRREKAAVADMTGIATGGDPCEYCGHDGPCDQCCVAAADGRGEALFVWCGPREAEEGAEMK